MSFLIVGTLDFQHKKAVESITTPIVYNNIPSIEKTSNEISIGAF